jgi:hypothetical protein
MRPAPVNDTSDSHLRAVAKFNYAASIVLRKLWGPEDLYELSHKERIDEIANHYGVQTSYIDFLDITITEMKTI